MADQPTSAADNLRATFLQGWAVALVAVFSYATARLLFHLHESYWAPIAAVVVLYPNADDTRRAAGDRFLGTVIGSLVGWGSAVWWHQNIFLYGLAVFLAVGICFALRLRNASRLCAVAVTVITLIPRDEPAYQVAMYRFLEVSYGVACAVVYAMLAHKIKNAWDSRKSA